MMTAHWKWITGLTLGLTVLFCASFVLFYQRAQQQQQRPAPSAKGIDKPLPKANLVDLANNPLGDSSLRAGRVVLVFVTAECEACMREAEFLRTVVSRKNDVRFYGVISYGEKASSLRAAERIFPFEVFYDESSQLGGALGITKVPIKLYLEEGVIRKAWGGATTDDQKKAAFVQWLDDLP